MDPYEVRVGEHRAAEMTVEGDGGRLDQAHAAERGDVGGHAPDRVQMLIEQLASPDADTRRKAAEALGELNDLRALAPLAALSVNDDSPVADAAVDAVGRLGGGSALAALQALMPTEESRDSIPRSRQRRREPDHGEAIERFEALGVLLTDPSAGVRAAAVAVLGKLVDPRAMGLAIAGLGDRDAAVRRVAAQVLGELGTAVATESLLAALDDPDPTVRCAVIDALGEIGDLRASAALVVVARGPHGEDPGFNSAVQEAARRALKRLAVLHPGKLGPGLAD